MKQFLSLLLLVTTLATSAQDKLLTMEDAMVKNRTSLAPENFRQLQFVTGTNDYVYLKKMDDKDVWLRGNAKSTEATPFLTLDQLNEKLTAAGLTALKTMPEIKFNTGTGWTITNKDYKISIDPIKGDVKQLISKKYVGKTNLEMSNAGYMAYLDNNNLFVTKNTTTPVQVTTDGSSDIVYASSVHRDEFGISKGTFWSNSGSLLAFYRMDQSMVNNYPIVDWSSVPAVNNNIKYPMAGGKSHHVTVAVYNAISNKTVYLKTGEPADQYLTNIAWSPDDKFVFIAVLNRGQNHMQLNQYDASTGDFIKTIIEEKDEKYVEPLVPMAFLKNNPAQFIWQSNRDGWNHLYLYNINGQLVKQLTKGNWEVLDVKSYDATGNFLFYTSTIISPVDVNLSRLNIKTGESKRITMAAGNHAAMQVSSDGNFVLDSYSSLINPRTIDLIDVKSGKTKTLLAAADPIASYAKGNLSAFTIKNENGDSLYCRLYKPVQFDTTKKYPVIVYWYGGSHVQLVTNSWNAGASDYWFQYMAERGYVVFSMDVRGSDKRGKAFEQSMFRKVGDVQMADLLSGVNYLQQQSYVDTSRMGLFGWSFGGFLTTDFMLQHPNVFKAAVAGGPVMNWSYYEVMYTERYMDTPQENPEGFAATNLISQVDKLKGKLLLIHGIQDPVVLQQNSVDFVKACVDKGVQIDYMIYPGHEHNVTGKDRAHLYQKVTDYFMQNLK